jgi:putative Mg2+ transporter-C (MgtC) family protein
MEFINDDIYNLLLAAVLSAVLGVEREWKGKSAGFRTLMLVSVGAALFTEISVHMALLKNISDPTRIASNIVTGIGFIGAGLIFKDEMNVQGLTTASTIWMAAAVGMAAGSGNYGLAVGSTAIAWVILLLFEYLEHALQRFRETRKYRVTFDTDDEEAIAVYHDFFTASHTYIKKTKFEKLDGKIVITFTVRAPQSAHRAAIDKMLASRAVSNMEY